MYAVCPIFAQNINCGYILEQPHLPPINILEKKKEEKNIYPCKPSFTEGLPGVRGSWEEGYLFSGSWGALHRLGGATQSKLSHGKTCFLHSLNKGSNQLCSISTTDQCRCIGYIDSKLALFPMY